MRLALIGTFFGRHENTFPLLHRIYVDATRKPDEFWAMCETSDDAYAIFAAYSELYDLELLHEWPDGLRVGTYPTPRKGGRYREIPYSRKINRALDLTSAHLIAYLDNGSMPGPQKYEAMAGALERHDDWGAVYCGQRRTGMHNVIVEADEIVEDAYCALNYTQVMHRKTDDRWPLDMSLADPDLADATFWRKLHASLGPFHPVPGLHDVHQIDGPKAQGV